MAITNVEILRGGFGYAQQKLQQRLVDEGHRRGLEKHGEKWSRMLYPSELKLRISQPPVLRDRTLEVRVVQYEWSDLVCQREVQPIGHYGEEEQATYDHNALCLTVNALLETADGQLVFHRKRGGAKDGSVHTFGGYVVPKDMAPLPIGAKDDTIETALRRDLRSQGEIGLEDHEFSVISWFGTPEGRLAALWDYGTAAIYGYVKTMLTADDYRRRIEEIAATETLNRELVIVRPEDVAVRQDFHPQTKQVIPTIQAIYSK